VALLGVAQGSLMIIYANMHIYIYMNHIYIYVYEIYIYINVYEINIYKYVYEIYIYEIYMYVKLLYMNGKLMVNIHCCMQQAIFTGKTTWWPW
jgi:hypothetical protein